MGCDLHIGQVGPLLSVSIHAPAWGATGHNTPLYDNTRVSIHAPAWGATFQGYEAEQMRQVSIHAPAWGATTIAS